LPPPGGHGPPGTEQGPRAGHAYLGGLAVVGGLMVVAALTAGAWGELATILAGGLALFLLGLIDDWRTVSPATKILVEVVAAVALWVVGVRGGLFGSVLDLPFTVLWVVAVTNTFNLLDNMDGLLSGVAAVALTFFLIAADRGDYLVASFSLAVAGAARIGEGRPPHVGGTDHSSHRLAARGVRGRGIALLTYSMQAALSGIALWMVGAADGSVVIAVPTVAIALLAMLAAFLRTPALERHRAGRP
ncbi:MAG: hypothetical protein ACRDH5_06995, partial [bacterium]